MFMHYIFKKWNVELKKTVERIQMFMHYIFFKVECWIQKKF